jgi:hypothetical protein
MRIFLENTKLSIAFIISVLLSGCASAKQHDFAKEMTVCTDQNTHVSFIYYIPANMDELKPYEPGRLDNWYSGLKIQRGNKIIKNYNFKPNYGYKFQAWEGPLDAISGCNYALIFYEDIGLAGDDDEKWVHNLQMCEIVSLTTGCSTRSEVGEFCGGHFANNMWIVDDDRAYIIKPSSNNNVNNAACTLDLIRND